MRDRLCCVDCGRAAQDVAHIIPRSRFGRTRKHLAHQKKNMACLCRKPCHDVSHTFNGRRKLLNILRRKHGYKYDDKPWCEYVQRVH